MTKFLENPIGAAIVLLLLLCGLVALGPSHPIADEAIYLSNLNSRYSPWSIDFIRNYQGTAGIVSTWFYFLLPSFFRNHLIGLRLCNVFFFVASVYLVFNHWRISIKGYALFTILFIPGTIALIARAMGDWPPVFFSIIFLVLLQSLSNVTINRWRFLFLFSAAILGSLAVIGKQSLSLIVFIWPFYLWRTKELKSGELIFLLFALVPIPLLVFSIWHGVSPASSKLIRSGQFNWSSLEYVFCWFVAAYLFLTANFNYVLSLIKKKGWLMLFLFLGFYLLQNNWNQDLQIASYRQFAYLLTHLLLASSAAVFCLLGLDKWQKKSNEQERIVFIIIILMALLSLTLSAIQMRYPAAFFPLILLFCKKEIERSYTMNYFKYFGLGFNLLNLYLLFRMS